MTVVISSKLWLLVLVAVAADADVTVDSKVSRMLDAGWLNFKARYRKNYETSELETFRYAIREEALQMIRTHNAQASQGLHSFELGENEFIDRTPDERRRMRGYVQRSSTYLASYSLTETTLPAMPTYTNTISVKRLPLLVNWSSVGWVGPVKNQGQCGSCWAYACITAIEAQLMNYTSTWVKLSEQNLIDCSSAEGNLGCEGGDIEGTFWYCQKKGIATLAQYPNVSNTTGKSNETCKFVNSMRHTSLVGWRNVQLGSEWALQQAVAHVGPVVVAIDASLPSFNMYKSGVYTPTGCNTTNLNHAVVAVGYGVLNSQPYWLIQNSWGTSWGQNGFMLLARNRRNMCGIATAASFPVIS